MSATTRLRLISAAVVVTLLMALSVFSWPEVEQAHKDPAVPWTAADGAWYRDVMYDRYRDRSFDLYVPDQADPDKPHGLILFIHGGGWTGGNKEDMQDEARSFAKAGYMTAVMDYTLITPYDPSITMMTMLDDIGQAIDKIHRTTRVLGYRVNKLGLYGYSAGAHLSMLFAYSRHDPAIPIAFVVAKAGRVDFTIRPIGSTDQQFAAQLSQWTGTRVTTGQVTAGKDTAAVRKISPGTYVTRQSPPTEFAYGQYDTLVRPEHGVELEKLLTTYEVPHKGFVFGHSGHGLDHDEETRVAVFTTALTFAQRYFD